LPLWTDPGLDPSPLVDGKLAPFMSLAPGSPDEARMGRLSPEEPVFKALLRCGLEAAASIVRPAPTGLGAAIQGKEGR
jgi:hypothetical protein